MSLTASPVAEGWGDVPWLTPASTSASRLAFITGRATLLGSTDVPQDNDISLPLTDHESGADPVTTRSE